MQPDDEDRQPTVWPDQIPAAPGRSTPERARTRRDAEIWQPNWSNTQRRSAIGREFATQFIQSEAYRASLQKRIETNTLHPVVEVMLWNYAFGKPKDDLDEGKVIEMNPLHEMTPAQLAARAAALAEAAQKISDATSSNASSELAVDAPISSTH